MSWTKDIHEMHKHFGVENCVGEMTVNERKRFMELRLRMMQEELDETKKAWTNEDNEEVVDGIIDLCVFAIGTLDLFNINAEAAWQAVLIANMTKEVGIKEGRDNPFNLPDLTKPDGWKAPEHKGNTGDLPRKKMI